MGSSKGGQVIGYKYLLGVDFKWCHAPIDAFRKIYVDNRLAWEGSRANGDIVIDKPELFGEYEGGVSGTLQVMDGNPTQLQNPYLVSKLGSGVPAYRGVVSTVLNRVYMGNNPYLKGWTAEVSRIHRRILNNTAIVQWQDAYAAIPPFSDTEDGYSSLVGFYGATLQPQQILIQIDLSSDANGFANSNFTLTGQGQDIVATKASVVAFLLYLKDQATWDVGDVDLGIGYFRGTNGTPATDNNGSPDVDPNTFVEGYVYEAPRRGVMTKVGLTKEDLPELIEYVQSLTVFPDTTDHTSTGVAENATEFFTAVSAGDKYRINYTYSTFDFEEVTVLTETNISSLNTSLSGGDGGVKYAVVTAGTYEFTDLLPDQYFAGPISLDSVATPEGWISVSECNGSLRSSNVGSYWATGLYDYLDIVNLCTIPAGVADPSGGANEEPPPDQTIYGFVSQQLVGLYANRWFFSKAWYRLPDYSTPFKIQYQKPDGTKYSVSQTLVQLGTSTSYSDNDSTADLLTGVYLTGTASAGLDMNPVHIIRECLTDQQWGLGIPEAEINEGSFLSAAITLYNERFGLSTAWNRQTEVEDFIKTILNHIDAVLYVRRDTGLWTIKLVRDDYDIDTIPEFTDDDVVAWEQVTRRSEADLVNSVTVKFNSRSLRGPASLTVNNLAQIQQLGAQVPATVNYPAVWQQGLAAVIAERDLRSLSSATISGSISVTRKGTNLYPADTFKLTSARYGLNGEVMRVVEINVGDGRQNEVQIKFVQDVFKLGSVPITGGGGSEWSDVVNEALPIQNRIVEEEGYRNFFRRNGEQLAGELYAYENNLGYLTAYGEAPTPDSLNARISYDAGAGYTNGGLAALCPTATIVSAKTRSALDTTWVLSNVDDLNLVSTNTLAYIDGEYVRVDSIDLLTNTIVVGRGCLDTVPRPHLAGARIFFFEEFLSVSGQQFVSSDALAVKLLTNSGLGQLPSYLAPIDSITFASRIHRPYPVGNFKINGTYDDRLYLSTLNLTWAHRDRTLQTGDIAEDHTATDIGPEAGVAYTVKGDEYSNDNTLVGNLFTLSAGTATSLSVNTATYPTTITDGFVRVYVVTDRGGVLNRVSPYIDCPILIGPSDLSTGAWHDVNILSSIFQDELGTVPVTTDGQTVGLIENQRTTIL